MTNLAAIESGALEGLRDERHDSQEVFRAAVIEGLGGETKTLPCKYFYDRRGSALFDLICDLDEYYLTRTEIALLQAKARNIAAAAGPGRSVVEFGSGSSVKVRYLLDVMERPAAYVPVDISREHMIAATRALARDYPDVPVIPVCADYTQTFELPRRIGGTRRLGFFPGSTIGNFAPAEACAFLTNAAATIGLGGALVIGVDLKKDERVLRAAYNDDSGITAAFNFNILRRINRELGADFDLDAFAHHAPYNAERGRIEMHLVSLKDQAVRLAGRCFTFDEGATIHTENSYKYTVDEFITLAERAGWRPTETWVDSDALFSVHYMVVP